MSIWENIGKSEDPYFTDDIIGAPIESKRIQKALYFVQRFGGIDGDHHKQWLITQMTKALLGSEDAWKAWELEMRGEYNEDEEEYEYGAWDEGIAP